MASVHDDGQKKPKKQTKPQKRIPERKCAGCNERREKPMLIRIVRSPEGEISIDRTGKKSGRGVYICRDPACLAKAVKAHRLQTSLSCEIPDNILSMLGEELAKTV